jgi:acetylornithine deacetylase/succinyl-diaminopimelate desuccinylase-like protein
MKKLIITVIAVIFIPGITLAFLTACEQRPDMQVEKVSDAKAYNTKEHDHIDPVYGKVFGEEGGEKTSTESKLIEINHASDDQLSTYDKWFTENEERHLKEVSDLVAFQTLAMDPGKAGELVKAGEYLKKKLTDIGINNATVHPGDGLPMVTAEWTGAKGQPTVLFYGHFDVQPADKSRWDSDPFKAEIRGDKMYGRGATDDKGPIISLLSTVEAMMKVDGKLPVNIMFLLDGAEEFGSQSMPKWLEKNKKWISKADYGYNLDAMMQSDDQGLMWKGLRGGGDVEVTITSASSDLHSGIYGGAVPNAAIAAAKIIDSMYNDDMTIAIEGWNVGLRDLSKEERAEIAEAVKALDKDAARKKLGVAEFIGDKNYTLVERTWIRTSLDVTGIKSGYTEGKASIIPHSAWFRVLSRTGPGHDAGELNQKIMDHIRKHTPWGVKVEMKSLDGGDAPFFSEDDLGFRIGKAVMTEFYGKPPRVLYVGGGVPALSFVPSEGGPQLVSFGIQRSDEGFHADNEFMRIPSFRKGQRIYAQLLHALVGQPERKK